MSTEYYFASANTDIVLDDSGAIFIGRSRSESFAWSEDTGFLNLDSVKQFMASNPGMVIKDEDDNVVSFTAFENIVALGEKDQIFTRPDDKPSTSNTSMSSKAQELLSFMNAEYKEGGYLYSGSWPYNSLKEKGYTRENIAELESAGLLQRRNCEEYAFELSPAERKKLIAANDLCSVWYEKKGPGLLTEIQEEAKSAANSPHSKSGSIQVPAMKLAGNDSQPDKVYVLSPFSSGQVIDVEYDLPKKMCHMGYASANYIPGGKAVGQFMVTDIVCNLLVDPQMNMLELQSMSAEFNMIHPDARTMLLFEDIVLKRLKQPSLDAQIDAASKRSDVQLSECSRSTIDSVR